MALDTRYDNVEREASDDGAPLLADESQAYIPQRLANQALWPLWTADLVIVMVALGKFIVLTSELRPSRVQDNAECFDAKLLNPPMVWEQRTFNSSVNIAEGFVTDYFHPASPTTSADWASVLDVMDIKISDAELARMPKGTAPLFYNGKQDGDVEPLEEQFYELPLGHREESERLTKQLDKHCFNYLWQTLMCHTDVSVMAQVWNPKDQDFNADFAVTKQCRNFKVIHNWAKNREA